MDNILFSIEKSGGRTDGDDKQFGKSRSRPSLPPPLPLLSKFDKLIAPQKHTQSRPTKEEKMGIISLGVEGTGGGW